MRTILLLLGLISVASTCYGQTSRKEEADRLVKEAQALHVPEYLYMSGGDPPDAATICDRDDKLREREKLILRLLKIAPNDPRTADLMLEQWKDGDNLIDNLADARKRLAAGLPPKVREADEFYLTDSAIKFPHEFGLVRRDMDVLAYAKEHFFSKYPNSKYVPDLLYTVHQNVYGQGARQEAERQQAFQEIVRRYPEYDHIYVVRDAKSLGLTTAPLGSRLGLSFHDALTDKPVSTDGKVLILDGWATYCASCIAIAPKLKQLYAKYHDNGLEIVGVSMDGKEEGGVDALRAFTQRHGCNWPQYYEGGYKAFCSKWKLVGGTVYVFDREGKLVAVNPKPEELESLVKRMVGGPPWPVYGGGATAAAIAVPGCLWFIRKRKADISKRSR